ncbi:TonB-dependent receptor [Segetibacter sp.]|uniref:SusC/RagA family TonB-linked outer membrane protein n=1 Tax=Segetibacter sp. TaxID=2231182 RepID=UPI00262AAE16|nr:TonB-dependent receptor [Segetibacter sp.]
MRKILLFMLLCISFANTQVFAQTRTVTGRVTDEAGNPVVGASVQPKGSRSGTTTDAAGNFSLQLPTNSGSLTVSSVNYTAQDVAVTNTGTLVVQLKASAGNLSEVVVVGYGTQTQRTRVQAASVVKGESFRNMAIVSPTQALQGQAAGVNMVNSSGLLGAASNVQVRGASSLIGGTQPLYVIDGVPLNDEVLSGAQGGGTGLNPLLDLNPNDIESMTVLKDAAAVSIYGSRGTNGVILIRTRRGANQKTRVSLDVFKGYSKPTATLPLLTGDEYRKYIGEYRAARSQAAQTLPQGDFDWTNAVLRQGKVNSYSLSAAGGNERTRFYLGGTYYNESGYTIGNDIRRLSGRINLDHDISKRVKVGVNYSLSNTNSDRIGAENNTFAPLTAAALFLPYVQPRDANGNFINTGFIANVLAIEELNTNNFISTRNTGNAFAEFTLIEGLRFRTDWGIDNVQAEERQRSVELITPGGSASRAVSQNRKWLSTNTLNYEKRFDEHYLGVLLGHSIEKTNYDNITVAATGFASDRLPNVASGSTPTTTFASRSAYGIEGYFSRLNYRFKNRYLLEGTIRRDGSSRFGAEKRYGTFYAVSGGWIVSDEAFFKNVTFMNNLKLTASYGTSGNDRIGGDFPSLGLFGGGTLSDYGGAAGLTPSQIPNPNLQWEETKQWDIGVQSSFFQSRINLNVNVYNKRTVNNLIGVPLPFTTGFPSVNQNVGEIENKGIDVEFNTVNVRSKNFEWSTSLNMGFVSNTVLSLPSNKDEAGRDFLSISAAQRAIVGYSRNTFYLNKYIGVNPETGDAEWEDKTGKAVKTLLAADRQIVGSAIPKYTGGFTNTVRFKEFDLTAFFNFAYGNQVLISGLGFTENLTQSGFNKSTTVLNYWKNPGDQAFAPKLSSTTAPIFHQTSTLQLLNGSYARLKTLSLGYRLPTSVLSRLKYISNARFYVQGQNLFIIQDKNFRGPDAEVSANGSSQIMGESFFALPQSRTITFGLNIGL